MKTYTKAKVPVPLRGPVVLFMAIAAGIGTSTIYSMQPAIAEVADSLDADIRAVGLALARGPAGYMIGLALLVPLVDRFAPGRVLTAQFGSWHAGSRPAPLLAPSRSCAR